MLQTPQNRTRHRVSRAASATRERLIDSAFELFSRSGFHAVGLDNVLADVGVSKQTFYNHFESKDELILETLHKRSHWELQTIREMLHDLAGEDPHRRLAALWDVLDAWFNRDDFRGCIFITAAAEFPSPHEPAHQAAADHSRAVLHILQDLATEAGARDSQSLSEQLMVLVEGALVLRHVTGNNRAADIARQSAQNLLPGFLPPSALEKTLAAMARRRAARAPAPATRIRPGLAEPMPDPIPPSGCHRAAPPSHPGDEAA